ncbi:MAG: hypothetical protein KDD35_04525 [Bdellovibrionales bacterium]|nr:hypothetical protein [Bdellovibrionales bacterium]
MTIEHDPRQTNLNFVDGTNRLYVDIEIPYHEMGDAAKRMIAARSIHFLKQDLAELWTNEKLPKTMEDLTNSAMAIGELQYEKIYQRIKEATGDKIRKAVEEALPDSIQRTTDQFAHFDWWRPSGLIVEIGAKGTFRFSFLNGVSGSFAEIVVPKCIHRVRKIPLQDLEKEGYLGEILKDDHANIIDRAANVVLSRLYGAPCTENLNILIERIQEKEGRDYFNNFYFVEESLVKSLRKFIFWLDAPIARGKGLVANPMMGIHGMFSMGVIYGDLRHPRDFAGATATLAKTFVIPESVRSKFNTWVFKNFPENSRLTGLNWGWQAKVGALVWEERFFPYFMMGPEVGTELISKAEVKPGTALDLVEFAANAAKNIVRGVSEGLNSGYSGAPDEKEDTFSLKEYAEERAKIVQEVEKAGGETEPIRSRGN